MEFSAALKSALLACIGEVVKEAQVAAERLSAREVRVNGLLPEVGKQIVQHWLEAQDEKYPADVRRWACSAHCSLDGAPKLAQARAAFLSHELSWPVLPLPQLASQLWHAPERTE